MLVVLIGRRCEATLADKLACLQLDEDKQIHAEICDPVPQALPAADHGRLGDAAARLDQEGG